MKVIIGVLVAGVGAAAVYYVHGRLTKKDIKDKGKEHAEEQNMDCDPEKNPIWILIKDKVKNAKTYTIEEMESWEEKDTETVTVTCEMIDIYGRTIGEYTVVSNGENGDIQVGDIISLCD